MNSIFFIYFITVFLYFTSACKTFGNKTECHFSCKTCSSISQCDDETKCTDCRQEYRYRILQHKKDSYFRCIKKCNDIPSYKITKDNYVCDVSSQNVTKTSTTSVIITQKPEIISSENIYLDIILFLIFVFLFILVLSAVLCIYFAFKKNQIRQEYMKQRNDVEQGLIKHVKNKSTKKEKKAEIKSLEIITNPKEIIKTQEDAIGSGSFSKVYKGTWKHQVIAIKVAVIDEFGEARKSIFKEFQIYEKVSHPNILPAFGAHFGLENTLVLALRKQNLTDYFFDYGSNLNFIQLKQYCIQVADALRYLHEKGILHCDLKIDNILVKDAEGESVEISDFGCAIDLKFDHNPVVNGTRTHLSYEVLKSKFELNSPRIIPSTASDVWSFAVTVWQIFKKTDLLPSDFQIPENIIKNYENGKMLPQPPNIPTELWRHIVFPCFNIHPKSRPSMNDLYNSFIKYQALPTETTSSTFIN